MFETIEAFFWHLSKLFNQLKDDNTTWNEVENTMEWLDQHYYRIYYRFGRKGKFFIVEHYAKMYYNAKLAYEIALAGE